MGGLLQLSSGGSKPELTVSPDGQHQPSPLHWLGSAWEKSSSQHRCWGTAGIQSGCHLASGLLHLQETSFTLHILQSCCVFLTEMFP